jgi:hypothetical protein
MRFLVRNAGRVPPFDVDPNRARLITQSKMQIGSALPGMPVATIDLPPQSASIRQGYSDSGANGWTSVQVSIRMARSRKCVRWRAWPHRQKQVQSEKVSAVVAFVMVIGRGPPNVRNDEIKFPIAVHICNCNSAAGVILCIADAVADIDILAAHACVEPILLSSA